MVGRGVPPSRRRLFPWLLERLYGERCSSWPNVGYSRVNPVPYRVEEGTHAQLPLGRAEALDVQLPLLLLVRVGFPDVANPAQLSVLAELVRVDDGRAAGEAFFVDPLELNGFLLVEMPSGESLEESLAHLRRIVGARTITPARLWWIARHKLTEKEMNHDR